jgi:hypothetical protein
VPNFGTRKSMSFQSRVAGRNCAVETDEAASQFANGVAFATRHVLRNQEPVQSGEPRGVLASMHGEGARQ